MPGQFRADGRSPTNVLQRLYHRGQGPGSATRDSDVSAKVARNRGKADVSYEESVGHI